MNKTLPTIQNYQIDQIKPVFDSGKFEFMLATVQINDRSQTIYISCENRRGALAVWFDNPLHDYEDRMSAVWNSTQDRIESGLSGWACVEHGMFDQAMLPVDNVFDDEFDRDGQTEAERELFIKLAYIADALSWQIDE